MATAISSLVSGSTGIDTDSLISQLVQLEYDSKITPVQNKINAYNVEISAYSTVKSDIADLSSKISAIKSTSDFDVFKTSSTDDTVATISGDTNCQSGDYSIQVYHAGTKEKLASSDGLITSQTTALSTMGITPGTISIGGTELSISSTDTIQDLRMKINNATDTNGDKLGVTASVIKLSDTDFRLVLTSKDSGKNGVALKDVTGSTFKDLGITTDTNGDIGDINQQITSDSDITAATSQLKAGDVFSFSGTDHDGNAISYSTVLTGTMSTSELSSSIKSAFHGTVDVSVGSDGKLSVTDQIDGTSKMTLNISSFGNQSVPALSTTQKGQQGTNVLSLGSNAYFNVDGLDMVSASNTAKDYIPGTTITIKKSSPAQEQTLSVTRDSDAVAAKIQAVVDSYNALGDYMKTATAYKDPSNSSSKDGDLAGDSTASMIMSNLSDLFHQQFSSTTGSFKNLASLGITTDSTTGKLTVDTTKLKSAIDTNLDDVMKLFTTSGTSTNTSVAYGQSNNYTASGVYDLSTTDDGSTFQIKLQGSSDTYTSDSRIGDIVKFSDGPAKGLMLTIPQGSMKTGDTATFTMSVGFGDQLTNMLNKFTDPYDGTITLHQQSITSSVTDANSRITTLTTQINNYQDRLTKQYAAMQSALTKMKSQFANMTSALGSTTTA
jgi:flagellar capping protein FliD